MLARMNAFDTELLHGRGPEAPSPVQLAARTSRFKANFLNRFIRRNDVADLIQFGCGDGKLPHRLKVGAYTGVDVAPLVLAQSCQAPADPARQFLTAAELPATATADLTLSVDAVQRLAAEPQFNAHIRALFDTSHRFVIIHGADNWLAWATAAPPRRLTAHIARYFPAWRLAAQVPAPFPPAGGDFFIYARGDAGCVIPVLAMI